MNSSSSVPSSPVIEAVDLVESLPKSPQPPKKAPAKKKKKKVKKQPAEDQVSMESISDDGFTSLVKSVSKEDVTNNTLLAISQNRPRRESICDVDNWFNNHIDGETSTLGVDNLRDVRMMRRGSDFCVGYDTGAVFPFGRSRHESESSEFFEKNTFSKSSDSLRGSNSSLNKEHSFHLESPAASPSRDHSSLLRFVVESNLANEAKTMEEIKNDRNKTIPSIEIVVTPGDDEDEDAKQGSAEDKKGGK